MISTTNRIINSLADLTFGNLLDKEKSEDENEKDDDNTSIVSSISSSDVFEQSDKTPTVKILHLKLLTLVSYIEKKLPPAEAKERVLCEPVKQMVHDLNERMKALRDSQLSVDLMEVTGMLNGLFGEERKHLAKERERKLQQRELALKENIFIAVVVAISAVFIAIVLKRLHISSVL